MTTVRASGVDLEVLIEGDGPLVVLLHGFPDTPHTWDATREALVAGGYRTASPFLRGYHPSACPADGDYSTAALGDDVAALIEALGSESAIVVGHDWGASAAYAAALMHPESVRFLATIAVPHPASIRPSPILAWRLRHFLTLRRRGAEARLARDNFALIDTLVRRWSPAWDVPDGETDAVKACFAEPSSLSAALGYYRALGARVPAAQRQPVPMAAIAFAGASDPVFGPAAFERARRWYASDYDVITLPGGHFLHREHPSQFTTALLEHIPRP